MNLSFFRSNPFQFCAKLLKAKSELPFGIIRQIAKH